MIRVMTLALALGWLAAAPLAQSAISADALARSLQDRYQAVRDFSASFVHTYRGGVLRTQATERGSCSS